MTIPGSRSTAKAIALAGLVMDVVVALAAIALRQPGVLVLLVLLSPIHVIAVLLMLRPTSLTFDGADVVYRVGGRETRTPRNNIATCALIGQQWVFSDSAGAQLFVVPALRFAQAEVTAFCKQAGLNLSTPPLKPIDQSRRDVSSAKVMRAVYVGIVLILLLFAGLATWSSITAQDALSRYNSAPVCGDRASTTSTCRLQTQARVTKTELVGRSKSSTTAHLTLIGAGGDYLANVGNSDAPKTGDIVNVEVWSGEVTRLGFVDTARNPKLDPSLDIVGVVIGIGLFAAIAFGLAVWAQVQLMSARATLRAAAAADSGSAGPVEAVHPDAASDTSGLPPCGIDHHPKEVFFAHWDPKTERTGVLIASVIAAIVLAVLVLLAMYVSVPIFGGIAALGVAWFGLQLVSAWRESRLGGVFADDLHVGKITTTSILGRFVRKVYERKSVLQSNIDGQKLTVVGVDGSTLFWTSLLAPKDIDRFVAFVGGRTVVEEPPMQPDAIAAPPVETPLGVLPVRVRRAAGIMQTIGGFMLVLGVINLVRLPGLAAGMQIHLVELLAAMALYGGAIAWLGRRLARGRPNSRQAALIGGAIATVFLLAAEVVIYTGPTDLYLFAILDVGALAVYGLVFYWLRDTTLSAGPSRST
jgi:hypothetical protein